MKKIHLLLICFLSTSQMFAAHFIQTGEVGKMESSYQIKDANITNVDFNANGYYEFFSTSADLNTEVSELKKTNMAEYISKSGRVHSLAKIFAVYEARARSVGDANLDFTSHEDTDVICVVKKVGKKFTIDIYTNEDARNFLAQKK